MSNVISPDLIQKLLFVNADKIYRDLVSDPAKAPAVDRDTTKLLSEDILNTTLSKEASAKLIERQHELVSACMAPSPDSALNSLQILKNKIIISTTVI